MASGLLSLKWNNHRSTFFHVLSSIRSKESYCDATLACDGRFYPVHKLVLSTCSEYFEQIFERTQCKHPVIVLKDIKSDDLEALMNYMYVGEVNVLQEKLAGLIKAAECLKIKGLAVPDEDPLGVKDKRNQLRGEWESPHAKRRRRDDSNYEEAPAPSRHIRLSQRDRQQISQLERGEANAVEAPSAMAEPEHTDNHNQTVESESEQVDSDHSNQHIKKRRSSGPALQRPSSQKPVPEVAIDETGVKTEPPDIQEEEVESKDALHSNLGYDPTGDGDSLGAAPGSAASGSNEAAFSDSNLMDATPQSVEDVVAQAMPPTSSSFQGNSFSLWEGEGSLQNFPGGEGFSGENSQGGRPMMDSPLMEAFAFARNGERSSGTSKFQTSGFATAQVRCGEPASSAPTKTQGKAHVCPFCQKELSSSNSLYLHIRSHTGEKPYSCNVCSFRCTRKWNLLSHLRRHTGEKPFVCPQCSLRFANNTSLSYHLAQKHPPGN